MKNGVEEHFKLRREQLEKMCQEFSRDACPDCGEQIIRGFQRVNEWERQGRWRDADILAVELIVTTLDLLKDHGFKASYQELAQFIKMLGRETEETFGKLLKKRGEVFLVLL